MTRPEGEEMEGSLVGICVGQKHLVELLNRGIHWLPSSGCSKTHQHHSWPSHPHPSGLPWQGIQPMLCSRRPASRQGACPLWSCSTVLWTVGAAVGPKLCDKEEIDHAVCDAQTWQIEVQTKRRQRAGGIIIQSFVGVWGWQGGGVRMLSAFSVCVYCSPWLVRLLSN